MEKQILIHIGDVCVIYVNRNSQNHIKSVVELHITVNMNQILMYIQKNRSTHKGDWMSVAKRMIEIIKHIKRLEERIFNTEEIVGEFEKRISKIEMKIGRFTPNNSPIYNRLDGMVDDINRIKQDIEDLKSR